MSGETYHNASGSTYNRQIGYVTNGTSTSNLPNRLTYTASTGENWSDIQYTYDSVGNITEINDGTRRYVYVYDALGQLTSETIYRGTQVTPEYFYTYTYDRAGNLVTGGGFENFLASDYSFSYTYGNAQWGDQLTALNGQAVTYDKSGNPLSYRGKTLTWTDNQHLQRYYYDSTLWFQYTYNRNGIRTGKNFYNMVKYDYVVDGDKVIAQTWLSNTMLFYYDQNGAPQSVRYNGTLYNYVLNLQGDVIQIRDTDGNLVVQYLYNAWGKVLKVVDADGNTVTSGVGYENPLRYRGYYYDWESGFYYLNSRYYDPEIGRFISPDSYVSTGQGLIGYNMYAYCGNNPVLFADYNGRSSSSALAKVIAVTLRLAAPYLKALQNKIREKVMENRKTSKACEDFIKEYEGFTAFCTESSNGKSYYVGYGHTVWDKELLAEYVDRPITEQEALALFKSDIQYAEQTVKRYAKARGLYLTQYQFDAYISYGYNVGPGYTGNVMDLIASGVSPYDAFGSCVQISDKSVEKGLNRRWFDAAEMYLYGDYTITPYVR